MLLFVSHLIPLSTTVSLSHHISLSPHLSLTVGYSSVDRGSGLEVRLGKSDRHCMVAITMGYSGVGRGSDMEVRLGNSDRRGMVAIFGIFGYVFWVHGYVVAWYGGLWRCVHGFLAWFVAARSVCS